MKNIILCVLTLIVAVSGGLVLNEGWSAALTNATNREEAASGPFRDGLYLGKLQADRGDTPRVSVGRGAAESDRQLFAAGFREGYVEKTTQLRPTRAHAKAGSKASDGGIAALRDGLYTGRLDAENGNVLHLAVGRWSSEADRAAYAAGYNEAYGGYSAHTEQAKVQGTVVEAR